MVHGDDFTSLGKEEDLEWFRRRMESMYSVKHRGRRGPGEDDLKSIMILNRIVEWRKDEIRYEPDPRHVDIIMEGLKLKSQSKSRGTPGVKDKVSTEGEEECQGSEASEYRALAARGV